MIFWTPTESSNLFNHLQEFNFILVTGPHRAGTTIATAMIANDLGHKFFEEPNIPPGNLGDFLETETGPAVIHCPSYCHVVHEYVYVDGLAVVLVRRQIDDIIASQRRVGWGFEQHELKKYGRTGCIARVKYAHWDDIQRQILKDRAFEIRYEDLRNHPMWVSREQRKDFYIAQIEIGKPRGDRIQNPDLANV